MPTDDPRIVAPFGLSVLRIRYKLEGFKGENPTHPWLESRRSYWDRGRPARNERAARTRFLAKTRSAQMPDQDVQIRLPPLYFGSIMTLFEDRHQKELRAAGWHGRGYLPHFDGSIVPQFITIHLADSIPRKVISRWKHELRSVENELERNLIQRRIEKYLDQGYGEALLKIMPVAKMVQDALLRFDGERYRLFAWVVMPNHLHSLMTRFDNYELKDILHSLKSYTAHEANKFLHRSGLLDGRLF